MDEALDAWPVHITEVEPADAAADAVVLDAPSPRLQVSFVRVYHNAQSPALAVFFWRTEIIWMLRSVWGLATLGHPQCV